MDEGGLVSTGSWWVTDTEGIKHTDQILGARPTYGKMPWAKVIEGSRSAFFSLHADDNLYSLYTIKVTLTNGWGTAEVHAPEAEVRTLTNDVRSIFDDFTEPTSQPELPPFKVFIGYGGDSPAWELVRDALRSAGIDVDAFTEAERAGQVTIDVVTDMIRNASMAVVVMSRAHDMGGGVWHTRQNVIHETGFAQAIHGVRNTIILLEQGVEIPSNLTNVTYIPYPTNGIQRVAGRVVTLVRETIADRQR